MTPTNILLCVGEVVGLSVVLSSNAWALETEPDTGEPPVAPMQYTAEPKADVQSSQPDHGDRAAPDVRAKVPIIQYAYSATGAAPRTAGAQTYGLALVARDQDATLGGGARVWGSLMPRLTLLADAERNLWGNFSPSVAAVAHLLGAPGDGWALGALGKFKVDGFSGGRDGDEIESEIELGVLTSFAHGGWHLDLNAIFGRGTGDEGETDAESRLRFGYDLGRLVRLGVDGQARFRLSGEDQLPNGKTWDFAAGPQLFVGSGAFYGALTAGPATMGLTSESVGFSAALALGGTT